MAIVDSEMEIRENIILEAKAKQLDSNNNKKSSSNISWNKFLKKWQTMLSQTAQNTL